MKEAWARGVPQPPVNVLKLNVENISTRHLEILNAVFVDAKSVDYAAEILSGAVNPAPPEEEDVDGSGPSVKHTPTFKERAMAPFRAAMTQVLHIIKPSADSSKTKRLSSLKIFALEQDSMRRMEILGALLSWCATSGELAVPVVNWLEEDEEEDDESEEGGSKHGGSHQGDGEGVEMHEMVHDDGPANGEQPQVVAAKPTALHAVAPAEASAPAAPTAHHHHYHTAEEDAAFFHSHLHHIRCHDAPDITKIALREVGFLYAEYHCKCWFWEPVELIRKLLLTSILHLCGAGTAGQVVVGLIIAAIFVGACVSQSLLLI